MFRNYARTELKNLLFDASLSLKDKNIRITYLDANFPFFNNYPMFPHLSHNDGKKIDISFNYLNKSGKPTNKKPSVSGYGAYALAGQNFSLNTCLDKGFWQYDFTKYLTFGSINKLDLDREHTRLMINELFSHPISQKIFIEPHLKEALQLENNNKVRFHGCHAVRHDDHLHFEIK